MTKRCVRTTTAWLGLFLLGACGGERPAARAPDPPAAAAAPRATATATATAAAAGAGSTIDARLQAIADEEIARAVDAWRAEAGVALVLEASSGAVLASAGREGGAPADVATKRAFITGSTLKAVTLAAALDEGVISPDERFDCERGAFRYRGKTMRDPGSYGVLTVPEMLATSTNVGFTKVFDRLGGARLARRLRAFHFGEAPPIEGATAGDLPAIEAGATYEGAVVAIGEAMAASPLQVAAAYAAFANDGAYVAPTLTRGRAAAREPIMKPETARAVMRMLDEAVNGELATGKLARFEGARVAGKTGTASWALPGGGEGTYASFVGVVPAAPGGPRLVVLVGLLQPRAENATGKTAAAPAFARLASRALAR
ncbi:MAG TPA: penicillin-binding transpeptidase domain-containing protein [Polyangiaceae bacterium]|nr:penicillin-binding transpeptidase domain-containing protein [Polyangiaceae bacterium]